MSSSNNQNTSNETSSGGKKQRTDDGMYASSSSPSSSANNEIGFDSTLRSHRSILIHPIGLLLVSILNEIPFHEKLYDLWNTLKEVKKHLIYQSCTFRDSILSSAMSEWNRDGEVKLTQKIKEKIDNLIEKKALDGYGPDALTIESENGIDGSENGKGKVDFLISEKCSDKNQSKRSVVMIIEFGMGHDKWWKKQCQILSYFQLLREGDDTRYIIDQPVLLTIVTIAKPTNSNSASTHNVNNVSSVNQVRFGVFLCIPNESNSYRLALLWRKDSYDVIDASKQFGKILYAAHLCANLRQNLTSTVTNPGNKPSYQYLGPNCCRIGDYVSIWLCKNKRIDYSCIQIFILPYQSLCHFYFIFIVFHHIPCCIVKLYRSYDNRLRPTERRPDLYETEDTDLFGDCHVILEIADTTNEAVLHPFGQLQLPRQY